MKKLTLNNAVDEAILEEMRRDKGVIVFGEDVHSGSGGVTHTFSWPEFGAERLKSMPICETMFPNIAVGMALGGMRPIVTYGFEDLMALSFDGFLNQAAKVRFWSHGKVSCPMVAIAQGGVSWGCGCNHTQKGEAWFANIPGLKILCPSTAADHKGMMKAAIRDNDPVIFMINRMKWHVEEELPDDEDYIVPLGKARIAREGSDVTVVCWQLSYNYTMELADELAEDGISIEVVDIRSLCPLDTETIINSVRKTGRLVVSHEAPYKFGPCAEIITTVVENAMDSLKKVPSRACTPMTAIPSLSAEFDTVVTKEQIRNAILKQMDRI